MKVRHRFLAAAFCGFLSFGFLAGEVRGQALGTFFADFDDLAPGAAVFPSPLGEIQTVGGGTAMVREAGGGFDLEFSGNGGAVWRLPMVGSDAAPMDAFTAYWGVQLMGGGRENEGEEFCFAVGPFGGLSGEELVTAAFGSPGVQLPGFRLTVRLAGGGAGGLFVTADGFAMESGTIAATPASWVEVPGRRQAFRVAWTRDGTVQVWVDGVLRADVKRFNRGAPLRQGDRFVFASRSGRRPQTIRLDQVLIATGVVPASTFWGLSVAPEVPEVVSTRGATRAGDRDLRTSWLSSTPLPAGLVSEWTVGPGEPTPTLIGYELTSAIGEAARDPARWVCELGDAAGNWSAAGREERARWTGRSEGRIQQLPAVTGATRMRVRFHGNEGEEAVQVAELVPLLVRPYAVSEPAAIVPTASTLLGEWPAVGAATLDGMVSAVSSPSEWFFEWGEAPDRVTRRAGGGTIAASEFSSPLRAAVAGSEGLSQIWYRMVVIHGGTTIRGLVRRLERIPEAVPEVVGLADIDWDSATLCDHDNDGDFDALLSRPMIKLTSREQWAAAQLMRTADGWMAPEDPVPLNSSDHTAAAFADWDGDGDIDLAWWASGPMWQPQLQRMSLLRNDGGAWVEAMTLPVSGVTCLSLGDYDNDGDEDLVVGRTDGIGLFRNDRVRFVEVTGVGLPAHSASQIEWGDYDNDGDLDLVVTPSEWNSWSSGPPLNAVVLRNTGGRFQGIAGDFLGGRNQLYFEDCNGDGRLDVVNGGIVPTIHLNGGAESVFGFPAPIAGLVVWSSIERGPGARAVDWSGDGLPDIPYPATSSFVSGSVVPVATSWNHVGLVTWSGGAWNMGPLTSGPRPVAQTALDAADWDGDGDADFLVELNKDLAILRNDNASGNRPPTAPTGLRARVEGGRVIFEWDAASDVETPAAGLAYQLRVGTRPGANDVIPSHAANDGRRLLPSVGRRRLARQFALETTVAGPLYWSVQAIDASLAGSHFAPEQMVTVGALPPVVVPPQVVTGDAVPEGAGGGLVRLRGELSPRRLSARWRFEWGMSPAMGNFTAWETMAAGSELQTVEAAVSNLPEGLELHYRLIGETDGGVVAGSVRRMALPWPVTVVGQASDSLTKPRWVDLDGDGRLDIVALTPSATLRLFRSTPGGMVAWSSPALTTTAAALCLMDADNDGDIDVVPEVASGVQTRWFLNTGGALTAAAAMLGSGTLAPTALTPIDLDRDGLVDLTGTEGGLWAYRNLGGLFVPDQERAALQVSRGRAWWVDYDGDGDSDLSDYNAPQPVTQFAYRNDGGALQPMQLHARLRNVRHAAWGDWDSDGDPDLAAAIMEDTSVPIALREPLLIFRNTGGVFALTAEPGVREAQSLKWVDADSDGDLDLAMTRRDPGAASSAGLRPALLLNEAGAFREVGGFAPEAGADVDWGDGDGDGRMEVLMSSGGSLMIAGQRSVNAANQPPAAPQAVGAELGGNGSVTLRWTAPADDRTPAGGLTYHVRIGRVPGGAEVAGGGLSGADGRRRLPEPGAVHVGTSASFRLGAGTYYWAVQAVDHGFAGGAFSPEGTFTVTNAAPEVVLAAGLGNADGSARLSGVVARRGQAVTCWFEWGTTPALGSRTANIVHPAGAGSVQVEATLTGRPAAVAHYFRCVASWSGGTVTSAIQSFERQWPTMTAGLPAVPASGVSAADYDGDGLLDLLVRHEGSGTNAQLRLYRNLGSSFVEFPSPGFANFSFPVAAWADYDGDQDLDVVVSGVGTSGGDLAVAYRNDGTRFVNIGLPLVQSTGSAQFGWVGRSVAWIDHDQDGDMDLIAPVSSAQVGLHENVGGVLTPAGRILVVNRGTFLVVADDDGDGDMDVLTGGSGFGSNGVGTNLTLLRNHGGNFESREIGTPFSVVRSGGWIDVDGDGRVEIMAAGPGIGSSEGFAMGWRRGADDRYYADAALTIATAAGGFIMTDLDNNAMGDFVLPSPGNATPSGVNPLGNVVSFNGSGYVGRRLELPFSRSGPALFADWSGDGLPDYFASVSTFSGAAVMRRNPGPANAAPGAPTGLLATPLGDGTVRLSWQAASDDTTPSAALTYQIRVGTSAGAGDVVSANALADGRRRLPGAAPWRTTFAVLRNLPATALHWTVQAVDSSGRGGPFAASQVFTGEGRAPELVSVNNAAIVAGGVSIGGRFRSVSPGSWAVEWRSGDGPVQISQSAALAAGIAAVDASMVVPLPGDVSSGEFRVVLTNGQGVTRGVWLRFARAWAPMPFPAVPGRFLALQFGDADGDGDFDAAFKYADTSVVPTVSRLRLLRNDGSGGFGEIITELVVPEDTTLSWGDADGDGDLDLLASSDNPNASPPRLPLLLRNDGGAFVPVSAAPRSYGQARLMLADANNDGRLDVTSFVDSWTDVNRDGILDSQSGSTVTLVRPGGAGFDTLTMTPSGAAVLADFDLDGDADAISSGSVGLVRMTALSLNHYGYFFSNGNSTTGFTLPRLAAADLDGDGAPDFVMADSWGSGSPVRVIANRNGRIDEVLAELPTISAGSLACVDLDGDGRLDVVAAALPAVAGGPWTVSAWRNPLGQPAAPPAAPTGLVATTEGRYVRLRWQHDGRGHTYRVRIGSAPGLNDIMPAHAGADGRRLLAENGPLSVAGGLLATLPSSGRLYWSVQAIDAGLRGGRFAPEQMVEVRLRPGVTTLSVEEIGRDSSRMRGRLDTGGLETRWYFEWGTTRALGNRTAVQVQAAAAAPVELSMAVAGLPTGDLIHYRMVAENAVGVAMGAIMIFSNAWQRMDLPGLPGNTIRMSRWADMDGDGDLDLIIQSSTSTVGTWITIHRNEGGVMAPPPPEWILTRFWLNGIADIDGDGLPELVVADTGFPSVSRVLRNTGSGFVVDDRFPLQPGTTGIRWVEGGDWDGDGDLDLSVLSINAGMLLLKRGPAGFSPGVEVPGTANASTLAWHDFDGDGDRDIFASGIIAGTSPATYWRRILVNEAGVFTEGLAGVLPNGPMSAKATLEFMDLDGDGDLDCTAVEPTGSSSFRMIRRDSSRYVRIGIWMAEGAGTNLPNRASGFVDADGDGGLDSMALPNHNFIRSRGVGYEVGSPLVGYGGFSESSGATGWGHLDGDGMPDLCVGMKLALNNSSRANLPPDAPSGLKAEPGSEPGSVLLTWQMPADDRTPRRGLTYSLRVGTTAGGKEIAFPPADLVTGVRRTMDFGEQRVPRKVMRSLSPGVYYWSVQAVDGAGIGGGFARESAFAVGMELSSMDQWRLREFASLEAGGRAAPGADPDGDGTVNLLEFALGLDPLVSGPQPVRSRVTDGGLVIEFDRPAAMAEVVNWVLEEATDPQATVGWAPSGSSLTVVDEADGRQTVRAVVPVVGQRKFVRLRVRMR